MYKYNPATNTVVDTYVIPEIKGFGVVIASLAGDLLLGTYADLLFVYNTQSKEMVYTMMNSAGQNFTAIAKAADGIFFTASKYLSAGNSKIQKVQIDISNPSDIKVMTSYVAEVKDQDQGESNPTQLLVTPGTNNLFNIYVAGLNSLYRINNVAL